MACSQNESIPPIRCVDDHNEALVVIHEAMRRGIIPLTNVGLMHFDAHPDLSVPRGLPASAIYCPRLLYEHLDSSSGGISEWILPLAFAGHISTVYWMRPNWSNQIPNGEYQLNIGAVLPTKEEAREEDNCHDFIVAPKPSREEYRGPPQLYGKLSERRLRVDSLLQYYVDDPWSVASAERMDPVVKLDLSVRTLNDGKDGIVTKNLMEARHEAAMVSSSPSLASPVLSISSRSSSAPISITPHRMRPSISKQNLHSMCSHTGWILDICLDYFGTYNPFAFTLEHRLDNHRLSRALMRAASEPMIRQAGATAQPLQLRLKKTGLLEAGLVRILQKSSQKLTDSVCSSEDVIETLIDLYEEPERARQILDDLIQAANAATQDQIHAAIDMVPCATLPHEPQTPADAWRDILHLKEFLLQSMLHDHGPPNLVSLVLNIRSLRDFLTFLTSPLWHLSQVIIARSSHDPYTPPERVRWLEYSVINMLNEIYGGCPVEISRSKRPRAACKQHVSDREWVNLSKINGKGIVNYGFPSELLEDAMDSFAHNGGIGIDCPIQQWSFDEGMLYGATVKWWGTKAQRKTTHEGLDFYCYTEEGSGRLITISPGTKIFPLLPGEIISVFNDFLAKTVVVAHRVKPVATELNQREGVSDSKTGMVAIVNSSHPILQCRAWPKNKTILTIYSHINVDEEVIKPGYVLDTADKKIGIIGNSNLHRKNSAPCHLHLSIALAGEAFVPPLSWPDMLEGFDFLEPPSEYQTMASAFEYTSLT